MNMKPLDPGYIAENVRRAAGLHLVSLDALAAYLGLTRAGLAKIVAMKGKGRALPRGENAVKLAEAFGVDARDLYSDRETFLRALFENFDRAPIRKIANVPEGMKIIETNVPRARLSKEDVGGIIEFPRRPVGGDKRSKQARAKLRRTSRTKQ